MWQLLVFIYLLMGSELMRFATALHPTSEKHIALSCFLRIIAWPVYFLIFLAKYYGK